MKDLEESYLRMPGFGEHEPLRRAWTVALSLLLYPA
jgi:hypothetical protein